ncbi:MAG: transcription antitermination factor NusB [SAR86 cluster bacterium]|nr:transcription antitermination factor NusB [SAR86 cluster bacterium]
MKESPMRSRDKALQSLYEMEINIDKHLIKTLKSREDIGSFCHDLIIGVIDNIKELDTKLAPHLDRSIASLDFIEKNVLRIATYELVFNKNLDHPIVINEAIRLSKKYGAKDSYKYINAILDKMTKVDNLKSHN